MRTRLSDWKPVFVANWSLLKRHFLCLSKISWHLFSWLSQGWLWDRAVFSALAEFWFGAELDLFRSSCQILSQALDSYRQASVFNALSFSSTIFSSLFASSGVGHIRRQSILVRNVLIGNGCYLRNAVVHNAFNRFRSMLRLLQLIVCALSCLSFDCDQT